MKSKIAEFSFKSQPEELWNKALEVFKSHEPTKDWKIEGTKLHESKEIPYFVITQFDKDSKFIKYIIDLGMAKFINNSGNYCELLIDIRSFADKDEIFFDEKGYHMLRFIAISTGFKCFLNYGPANST